jgi:ribosome-associated protein
MAMNVTENIQIPESELQFTFARSGGPGGQNVNKVASKAVLHWNVAASPSLPSEWKERFRQQNRWRITTDGVLVLDSQRFRDQAKNVADCLEKLRDMLLRSRHPPKKRRPTKPSRSSKERRLTAKRHVSRQKAQRKRVGSDE